jgi:putative nucleotidyltransferase with HDIG domain
LRGLPELQATAESGARANASCGVTHEEPPKRIDGTVLITLLGDGFNRSKYLLARIASPTTLRAALLPLYVVALALCAVAVLVSLVAAGEGFGDPLTFALLASVAVIVERWSIRIGPASEESIALLPIIFAAVLLGPLPAMLVGVASMTRDLVPQKGVPLPYLRWGVYTSARSLTGAMAGFLAAYTSSLPSSELGSVVAATVTAAIAANLLDIAFALLTLHVRGSGEPFEMFKALTPGVAASVAMYTPVIAILAFAFETVSVWTIPLFVLPALVAQRSLVLYHEQRQLSAELYSANTRLERANLSFATALVATLDARDRYTAGHSATVAVYARDIAARMGLSDRDQQLAHLCGLVHDVGKIGLPAGLLEKEGPLTLAERRQMERHSEIGETILAKVDDYAEIAKIVRHHHERVDGNGYPDRLHYDEIPLISRILAVADAYDAMTSDRPYREAMPSRVARLRLAQAVESQFDTAVVAAFEAILARAEESYRTGGRSDFELNAQLESYAPLAAAV